MNICKVDSTPEELAEAQFEEWWEINQYLQDRWHRAVLKEGFLEGFRLGLTHRQDNEIRIERTDKNEYL